MIETIKKLLGLCNHKWEVIREIEFKRFDGIGSYLGVGIIYTLQCKECGNIKSKRV